MGQCALGAPDGKSAAGGQVPLGGGRRGVGVLAPSDALAGDQGRFFADIQRTSSFELRAKWSGTTEPILPEFARAAALICVEPVFMASTRALVSLQAIEARFRRDPLLHRRMCDRRMFESTIAAAVMRAYDLPNEQAALQQRDVLHDCLICERIASLHAQLEWRQPYLTYALELIGTHEDADALAAKLSEVCDRAERCSSAKRHAFSIVIGAAYELLESSGTAAGASAAAVAEVADAPAAAPLGATLAAAAATVATPSGDLSTLAGARAHVHRVFADFLDEQKEAAVMASFTEPSRFYFDTIGDTFGRDHVTVHGVNWFLAVLHAALGVQAPFLVDYEDRHVLGIADVWLAFSEECWAIFSHPRNFGKQFGGIRELSERRNELLVAVVPSGQLPRGHRTTAPKLLGNMAVHAHSPKQLRLALARYCERFAHFFAHEPFARRCFEGLWSEQKPEHAGFRRACDTLYEAYRVEVGATQASLIEHAYADECYAELDLEAASAFLSWCGLLKPTSAFALYRAHRTAAADVIAAVARGRQTRRTRDAERQSARTPRERAHGVRPDFSPPSTQRPGAWAHASTAERVARAARFGAGAQFASGATSPVEAELEGEPAGTVHGEGGEAASSAAATLCPICCETRADVEQLPHWEARGDVSAHRMCAVCRASYTANTCPFCKEVLAKEELLAHISNFIDVVSSRARIADPDPNELAALLERWQTFEMELDAQPFVLRRVTQLIVEDTAFSSRLAQGVQLRASWLRDTAGVLFRFHALAADGELRLRAPGSAALLAEAVETLLEPFERDPPAPMHGHYYGALYSQALVPWLCAWRSGTSTRTAAALVMRVGHAIVRAQHTYGSRRELRGYVRARMHLEYVQLAHEPVWGGKERDIVWQTFWTEA